jgi:hypothetical protein
MNATALKRLRVNGSRPSGPARPGHGEQAVVARYQKRRFHRPRRRHDPMLAFNMSTFNSAQIRQCIFNSLPQRQNVWP